MSPTRPPNGEQSTGLPEQPYANAPGPGNAADSSLAGYPGPLPGSGASRTVFPVGEQENSALPAEVIAPQRQSPIKPSRRPTRAGAAWVALIVAAIVLIFLLIFIVQNSGPVQIRYFGFEGTMSLGVAMLFAAVAGALTAGLLGTVRIMQLRTRARRARAGK